MAKGRLKTDSRFYSGLNLNQDKATKPQTVQIVRQGEATPYWFKVNPLYCGVFRRPLPLIFHRFFGSHLVDEAGNAHAAFERFVVFEVQFGRFEEFDAFR